MLMTQRFILLKSPTEIDGVFRKQSYLASHLSHLSFSMHHISSYSMLHLYNTAHFSEYTLYKYLLLKSYMTIFYYIFSIKLLNSTIYSSKAIDVENLTQKFNNVTFIEFIETI